MNFRFATILSVLLAVLGLTLEADVRAETTILSSMNVVKSDGVVRAEVRFDCSLKLVSYEPQGMTQQLNIQLVPIGRCMNLNAQSSIMEMNYPGGSQLAGIRQAELSGSADELTLTVRFSKPTSIEVSQPGGVRSLQLALLEQGQKTYAALTNESAPQVVARSVAEPAGPYRAPVMRVHSNSKDDPLKGAFVVNLQTSREMPISAVATAAADGQQLYVSKLDLDGVEWFRLRFGFFTSEGRAEAALANLKTRYPAALVVRVDVAEYQIAANNKIVSESALPDRNVTAYALNPTGLSEGRLAELMEDGRGSMLAADYIGAIEIYTKVLREGDTRYAPDAQEYLGLAREKNGQLTHAVAEYRRYLASYQTHSGSARVQQRLDGILLAGISRKDTDATQSFRKDSDQSRSEWNVYGGFAQYYRHDSVNYAGQGSQVIQSSVLSDIDVITRRQGQRFNAETRMTFSNFYDLLGEDEGSGSDTRFYYMYADVADQDTGFGARVGRQRMNSSGVLSRFDGARLSWQVSPDWRVNLMSGEPVYSTSRRAESERNFYGLSVDAFDLAGVFDASMYYNTQEVDGITDRQAVGGELRYYNARASLVSSVDYDVGYNTLNNIVVLGNWAFDDRLTFNARFDFRRSPYLLSENALIGQGAGSIDELRSLFSDDEIRELAEARSGEATTVTLGLSRPLFERFQVNADVTMSDYSGTAASNGVAEITDLGAEYYYNLNFVGSSLLTEGDSTIFTLRYIDGSSSSTVSVSADGRFPMGEKFRLNPRVMFSQRDISISGFSELLVIPALRMFYQFSRSARFEMELGGRWSDATGLVSSTNTTSWFFYTGYRTAF